MKKFLALTLALAMLLCLAACGSKDSTLDGNNSNDADNFTPIEWTAVGYLDSSNYHSVQQKAFCDAVTERTNGRLTINFYAAGELPFTGYEFVSITSDGTAQITFPGSGYYDTEVPSAGVAGWLRMCSNNDQVLAAMDALKEYNTAAFAEYGVEYLGLWTMAGQGWFGTGAVPTQWSDLKGMKFRTHSSMFTPIMTPYGIEPVSISWGEVIPSLQRGVCNGALTGMTSAYSSGWQEVTDWVIPMEAQCCYGLILVNSAALAALPEDIQQIVREEAANYQEVSFSYNEEANAEVLSQLQEAGLTIVELSDEDLAQIDAYAAATWEPQAKEYNCEDALAIVREVVGK